MLASTCDLLRIHAFWQNFIYVMVISGFFAVGDIKDFRIAKKPVLIIGIKT